MNRPNAVSASGARPVTMIAGLFALVIVGNAFVVGCGGKSDQTSQTPEPAPAATTPDTASGAAGGTDAVALGNQVYQSRCVLCHGAGGKGDGTASAGLNPKPRNHTDGTYMNARTNDQLLEVIRKGKGAMPAWGTVLSDQEIHAVLAHVRSLADPPYTGPTP